MKIVISVSNIPVRLTEERLSHIEKRHPEMEGGEGRILETLSSPDFVQEGDSGTLIAVKLYPLTPLSEKFCVVVYKELSGEDGFVITAYYTSKPMEAREIVWKP